MRLHGEDRQRILDGLQSLMWEKWREIDAINARDEHDYRARAKLGDTLGVAWALEEFKANDVQKVQDEIDRIEKLSDAIEFEHVRMEWKS